MAFGLLDLLLGPLLCGSALIWSVSPAVTVLPLKMACANSLAVTLLQSLPSSALRSGWVGVGFGGGGGGGIGVDVLEIWMGARISLFLFLSALLCRLRSQRSLARARHSLFSRGASVTRQLRSQRTTTATTTAATLHCHGAARVLRGGSTDNSRNHNSSHASLSQCSANFARRLDVQLEQ